VEGTAIKLSETKWQVILSDGSILATEQNDLLDSSKFYVKKALNRVSIAEERKAAQKVKRRRQIEHKAQEAVMLETAREERRKRDKEEFEKMLVSIAAGTESGNPYDFKAFEELLLRLRSPFKTTIDGFAITVAESDAAIMMEDAALEVVKKRILGENKRNNEDDTTTNNKKKRRTGGNAAVSTVYGATHLVAHHSSHRRDLNQNKKAREKTLTGMDRELKNIQATMLLVEKRKKHFAGLERERSMAIRAHAATEEQELVSAGPRVAGSEINEPVLDIVPVQSVREYWEIREGETDESLVTFLRLFCPTCGKLSKNKEEKWAFIARAILPKLSPAFFESAVENYQRRATELQQQIEDLRNVDVNDDDEPNATTTVANI
jgi:hypothetical protein